MRKLFITVLAVALGAALVYGATMAWFTDTAEVADTEFKAGTVEIGAQLDKIDKLNGASLEVLNPGDSFDMYWDITNTGSKEIAFRIVPDFGLTMASGKVNPYTSDVYCLKTDMFKYVEGTGWVDTKTDSWEVVNGVNVTGVNNYGLALLYTGTLSGTLEGTPGMNAVKFGLNVTFQGDNMTNAFQGAKFTIGGVVQAIQSHNAYNVTTNPDGWTWNDFAA
jgi:predicted ribosomally synthesized peptide with SipW-like signal peptide